MKQRISPAAFALIVKFESGDRPYYEKFLKRPSWPGGASGVTIGFGYEKTFREDWSKFLTVDQLARLERCYGKTRLVAKQALSGVRDIEIPWEAAEEIFNEKNLPREIHKTLSTFPGSAEILPGDAFGALVSLIFNRGEDLAGDRRSEMRDIRGIIQQASHNGIGQHELCRQIASRFRAMKRLWHDDPDSDGDLVDRREAEAKLIEAAA
jgi:GH24 family phage-related lysozyme (muramidase)